MSSSFLNIPNHSWRPPVSTASALPATSNQPGDAIITLDTDTIYVWSGSAWVSEGGGGGVTSLNTLTGALTIAAGTGISVTPSGGNTLTIATTGSGTVTAVSVASANGFAGTSSGGTTPALTLSTTITGILQGNGTSISAATTTGSGAVVLANTPTLITPTIGVATATSIMAAPVAGTNVNGNILSVLGGTSTGTGIGGAITMSVSPIGSSGSSVNAAVEVARFDAAGLTIGNTTPQTARLYVTSGTASDSAIVIESGAVAGRKMSFDFSGSNIFGIGRTGTNYAINISYTATGGTGANWIAISGNNPGLPVYPQAAVCTSTDGNVTALSSIIPNNGTNINGAPWWVMTNNSSVANTLAGYVTTGSSKNPMSFAGTVNVTQTSGSEVSNYIIATQKAGTLTEAVRIMNTGQLKIQESGAGLSIKTGSNCKMGTAVLSSGTVTVSNTAITASSLVFLTPQVAGGTQGVPTLGTVTAGVNFVINSSNALDSSTIAYLIMEPS